MFVGGGTPSLVPASLLGPLLKEIELLPGAEVTVEANPENVSSKWADEMVRAGVNRVSLGVQSFDPAVLESLGRQHSPEAVQPAVDAISKAGIARYSVDLIYGAVAETDRSWEATLKTALALQPAPLHVSAYGLTVEPGTPLAADSSRHPDDDVQAGRYEIADAILGSAGLAWYEISNWARPGEECRHNVNYWLGGDYLGVGCAAHSHRSGTRWWNVRTPERFIEAVAENRSPVAVREELSPSERAFELLELSLRMRRGVPAASFGDSLEELCDTELLAVGGDGRAVLTLAGRLLANEVACRLDETRFLAGLPS